MGTITAFPLHDDGVVRVEIDWSDIGGPPRKCWAYRVLPSGGTTLRGADPVLLSGGRAVLYDTEAPLDTPMTYRSIVALNSNGDFEDGVDEWLDTANSGTVGTVTQTFDYYVAGEGRAALKLVQASSALTTRAVSDYFAVTVGVTYSFSGKVMLPSFWGSGVGIQVHWYNGTTFLSASGAMSDLWPTPGEWSAYSFSATAPATATNARLVAGITGTAPTGTVIYVDEMYATRSGVTTIESSSVTLNAGGNGWWTDPLHPATKLRLMVDMDGAGCTPTGIAYLGMSDRQRPADNGLLEVNNGKYPVGTWATRKSNRRTIRVATANMGDLARLEALHEPGAPLLLQLPPEYNEPDHYAQHSDLTIGHIASDQRIEWRIAASSFAEVLAPVGEAEGVLGTRYQDINRWTTFQQVEAAGGGLLDTFQRSTPNAWGSPDSGPAWSTTGTATNFSVNGTTGLIAVSALNSAQIVTSLVSLLDLSLYLDKLSIAATPTGASGADVAEFKIRYVNVSNFLSFRVFRNAAAGTVTVAIRQLVAGVETFIGFPTVAGIAIGDEISVRYEAIGTTQRAKIWKRGTVEPLAWTQTQVVTHVTAGGIQLSHLAETGITNTLPYAAGFDDLRVANRAAGAGNTWFDLLQGEGYL